jgi:hypothetical protein
MRLGTTGGPGLLFQGSGYLDARIKSIVNQSLLYKFLFGSREAGMNSSGVHYMVLRIIDYLDNCNLLDFIRDRKSEQEVKARRWEEFYMRGYAYEGPRGVDGYRWCVNCGDSELDLERVCREKMTSTRKGKIDLRELDLGDADDGDDRSPITFVEPLERGRQEFD